MLDANYKRLGSINVMSSWIKRWQRYIQNYVMVKNKYDINKIFLQ